MPRRTITEARGMFETEMRPTINEYWTGQLRQQIERAEQDARERASHYVEERMAEALSLRDHALRDLTAVRDEYDQLTAQGSEARISATDFTATLNRLHTRQREADALLDRADAIADELERVDADPVAWFDELTERMPTLRKEWPF